MRAKLVVELDGGHHSDDKVAAKDAMRTRWLEGQGYKVLRFWNAELNSNLDGVLDTIYAALYSTPSAEARPFSRTHAARPEQVQGETRLSTSSSPHPGENASHSRRPSPSRGG